MQAYKEASHCVFWYVIVLSSNTKLPNVVSEHVPAAIASAVHVWNNCSTNCLDNCAYILLSKFRINLASVVFSASLSACFIAASISS